MWVWVEEGEGVQDGWGLLKGNHVNLHTTAHTPPRLKEDLTGASRGRRRRRRRRTLEGHRVSDCSAALYQKDDG